VSDPRNRRAARVPCPTCGAMHGRPCTSVTAPLVGAYHPARVAAGDRAVLDAKNARAATLRGTISINGDLYAELQAEATRRGLYTGGLVDALIIDGLNAAGAP